MTLNDILTDKKYRKLLELFKIFSNKEKSYENLDFMMYIVKLNKTKYTCKIQKDIINKYIKDDAKMELNISPELKHQIINDKNLNYKLISDCYYLIYNQTNNDIFLRFCGTTEYKNFINPKNIQTDKLKKSISDIIKKPISYKLEQAPLRRCDTVYYHTIPSIDYKIATSDVIHIESDEELN